MPFSSSQSPEFTQVRPASMRCWTEVNTINASTVKVSSMSPSLAIKSGQGSEWVDRHSFGELGFGLAS